MAFIVINMNMLAWHQKSKKLLNPGFEFTFFIRGAGSRVIINLSNELPYFMYTNIKESKIWFKA